MTVLLTNEKKDVEILQTVAQSTKDMKVVAFQRRLDLT